VNEKIQTMIADGIAHYGEQAVGAPAIAAAELKTETQTQGSASAHWIMDHCYPYGRGFIIGRWSEQFGVTEMILKTAALPEAQPHIERLKLTELFDLLKRTHVVYGERMGFTALKPGDTESPLYRWHEALEAYLGAVVFTQKKNPELKATLTAPYDETAKAIRDARKRAQKQQEAAAPQA
jgi:hypothetical protein